MGRNSNSSATRAYTKQGTGCGGMMRKNNGSLNTSRARANETLNSTLTSKASLKPVGGKKKTTAKKTGAVKGISPRRS